MFRIKLLDRYIFKELLEPFLFGLLSFSLIFSASMVVFELVRAVVLKGMPLYVALQLFLFRLPGVVVYIFPMAMLLASLLSFARFSKDSEIVAFRAGGISLHRLVIPALIMGLIVSFITFYFYEVVVPESNKAVKNLLIETAVNHRPKVEENIFVPEVREGVLQRIIYARKMEGQVMHGIIIQEFTDGRLSQIVNAKEAYWQKDENKWQFKYGTIYFLSETGEYRHLIKFETQEMAIKYSPADLYVGEKNPDEMNIRELSEFIKLKEKMGTKTIDYKIQLNLKIAIPFASFVFALLGAPLGLSPRRASSSIGLGLSIIVIFVYYVLMFFSMALGELEWVSPPISAWLPNIITSGIGVYFLNKAAKQ